MKKNFCCGLAAFTALAFTACSDDSTAVVQPIALDSSSSVIEESSSSVVDESSSSAIVESSSSAVAESSSSSFGLSSSGEVSSSSQDNSSSSLQSDPSSSSIAKSSVSECRGLIWFGNDPEEGVRVPVETCAESSWPKSAIPDGRWRLTEIDTSCVYCDNYVTGESTSGNSSVIWYEGESENDEVPTSTIEACNGVCGTAVLEKGTLTFNPFVSIGFTLARDSSGNPIPVDVSNWGGICIVYASQASPSLELDLGDSINANVLNYALPSAPLPKAAYQAVKCIPWSSFNLPSWFKGDGQGWKEDTGVKAAKQLVSVRFKLQATPKDGGYEFNIRSISAYNSGSGFAAGSAEQ